MNTTRMAAAFTQIGLDASADALSNWFGSFPAGIAEQAQKFLDPQHRNQQEIYYEEEVRRAYLLCCTPDGATLCCFTFADISQDETGALWVEIQNLGIWSANWNPEAVIAVLAKVTGKTIDRVSPPGRRN